MIQFILWVAFIVIMVGVVRKITDYRDNRAKGYRDEHEHIDPDDDPSKGI